MKILLSITFLLLTVAVATGQSPVATSSGMLGNEEIVGRIFFPPGDHTDARPVIKLQSLSSPEVTGVADRDGYFRFTHLRPDQYTVVVDGGEAYEKGSESVIVGHNGGVPAQGNPFDYAIPAVYQVQIYLKPRRTGGSVNQPAAPSGALADIPAAARERFNKALEYARAGQTPKAIEQLQAAIAQAPKFTLAYNELGVQFLKSGRADRAAEVFKAALAMAPTDFTLRLNYGVALLNQKKFDDAETQLRDAIQRNASSPVAHYYLGLTLLSEQKFDAARGEFENTIRDGGERLALAHKYLGGVYWRNNAYRQAADELEKYLKLEPKAPDARKIRDTIKELRSKS